MMEISWLLTDEINLEQEKMNLQLAGLSWPQIEQSLRLKYGESSKKGLFQCNCCHSVTTIVLSNEKICHFKHKSTEKCAAKENYKRSLRDKSFQNNRLHFIGKSAIRNQLNHSLSRYQANILDGYLYRKELKYVPDFIVEWPNGEIWSFDYITGTKSDVYQQYLIKKQIYYKQLNFKSYFLFNENQIASHEIHNALALSLSEKGALSFLSRHSKWEECIVEIEKKYGKDALAPDVRLILSDNYVNRLMYFTNEFEGMLYHITRLSLKPHTKIPNIPNQWYMVLGGATKVPLDDLFRYNEKDKVFAWEDNTVDSKAYKAWEQYIVLNQEAATATFLENKNVENSNNDKRAKIKMENITTNEAINRILTADEEIQEMQYVISRMKNSELLVTNPAFIERIKECEAALELYRKDTNRVFPEGVRTKINMMKNAMKIK